MRPYLVTLSLIALIIGCAPAISQQARDQVTLEIPFSELLRDPARLAGEVVLIGGKIIATRPLDRGTELVLLQLPLEIGQRPNARKTSEGRYLVQADEFLDPAVYAAERLVTIVAKIRGVAARPLGKTVYRYPELDLIELKLWPAEPVYREPRFQFGIGVGTHF
ncbi:MAG: Slp family lipoprotein [Desulfosarcinaceae bacterium]|nr:Slp family lipoprotein [Desulfosarcinaceae bacterium]